jgi:hypothetical protein
MNKRIEITVAPDGSTKVETKGFAGTECQQASRFVEVALGRRVGEQLTEEFYSVRAATEQRQTQG